MDYSKKNKQRRSLCVVVVTLAITSSYITQALLVNPSRARFSTNRYYYRRSCAVISHQTSSSGRSSSRINRTNSNKFKLSSSSSSGLELVVNEEKTNLQLINEFFMDLNERSRELRNTATKSSDAAIKVKLRLRSFLLKLLFVVYRVYRGFFVLVPALLWTIIKEARGESIGGEEVIPNWFQKTLFLKTHSNCGKRMREKVVRNYFDGVTETDPDKIRSCFAEQARIRDVCNLSGNSKLIRTVQPQDLTQRCMEFLDAHPDAEVNFYYPPTCGKGPSRWVFAHWFETGTWQGESCGIQPTMNPLEVEGQTRFYVNDDCKIEELVVTRTFSEWEKELFDRRTK